MDLIKRSRRMPQVEEGWQVTYALFARQGFTEATQAAARELHVQLVTLQDIESVLSSLEQG
jgi:hypothetical protein